MSWVQGAVPWRMDSAQRDGGTSRYLAGIVGLSGGGSEGLDGGRVGTRVALDVGVGPDAQSEPDGRL